MWIFRHLILVVIIKLIHYPVLIRIIMNQDAINLFSISKTIKHLNNLNQFSIKDEIKKSNITVIEIRRLNKRLYILSRNYLILRILTYLIRVIIMFCR